MLEAQVVAVAGRPCGGGDFRSPPPRELRHVGIARWRGAGSGIVGVKMQVEVGHSDQPAVDRVRRCVSQNDRRTAGPAASRRAIKRRRPVPAHDATLGRQRMRDWSHLRWSVTVVWYDRSTRTNPPATGHLLLVGAQLVPEDAGVVLLDVIHHVFLPDVDRVALAHVHALDRLLARPSRRNRRRDA